MTPERQEPYDGRPSRTVLWEPGNHGSRATRLHVGVPVRTRYACTPPRRRQLPDPSDVPLPEGAVLRLLRRRNRSTLETQKRREGVVIFVMYFFNEPRTNLRISAGPQSPWNAMALQPARRGTPDHAAGRPLMACQPRPKVHNYRAGNRPGRCASTRPGKGISRPLPQFRKLARDTTHTPLTREGFVYPAGRDGAACSKRIVGHAMARTHANRTGSRRPGELAMRNSLPVKRATPWIELCCNQTELHSSIGYRSTNEVNQDTKENRDNSLTKTQVFNCRPENL